MLFTLIRIQIWAEVRVFAWNTRKLEDFFWKGTVLQKLWLYIKKQQLFKKSWYFKVVKFQTKAFQIKSTVIEAGDVKLIAKLPV